MGYSVFRNTETGKRAWVAVNYDIAPRKTSLLSFEGNTQGTVRVYQPYSEAKNLKLPVSLTLPAERLVIVVEE